ncbi:conserved hypothetical protein [metagenome]|uniref:Uncharacterized protein n=1 Tax=metagenome TaxID=256318 RepID=A0A2P2BXG6_9ZZZZ
MLQVPRGNGSPSVRGALTFRPVTSLGMPSLPPPADPVWKQAWDAALYGASGYLRSYPMTASVDAATLEPLIDSLAPPGTELALLGSAGALAPDLSALGRVVRFDVPEGYDGLVVALDWLSHVPTHVVQMDPEGYPRLVHVSPRTGHETLGARLNETSVPQSIGRWLEQWWPVVDFGPGARAEVGTSRDTAWAGVTSRLAPRGRAVAIDAGHSLGQRPRSGSLRSSDGPAIPDGSRDLTAAVALDAVAAATSGRSGAAAQLTYVTSEGSRH